MVSKTRKKLAQFFECNICDYYTSRKNDYDKHLLTPKHIMVQNGNENSHKLAQTNTHLFRCDCGKGYKNKSHLYRHKKDCVTINYNSTTTNNKNEDKEIIKDLINENRDLVNKIVEQNDKIFELAKEPKTINNTINNTNNNMTINVFLNEKCKDAINLIDFVKNMQINWEDTKETGKLCIEESLTELIMDKVKDMDITERPIHCTDKKRLQYYVKDGEWKNKDVDQVFDSVLYDLSKIHINNMVVYGEEHPEWIRNDDNTETYFGITTNCMIYRHEMEQRRNKVKKLLSEKVLLKKEDYQN